MDKDAVFQWLMRWESAMGRISGGRSTPLGDVDYAAQDEDDVGFCAQTVPKLDDAKLRTLSGEAKSDYVRGLAVDELRRRNPWEQILDEIGPLEPLGGGDSK